MILYHDRRSDTPRWPAWLHGAPGISRVHLIGGGALVAVAKPWSLGLDPEQVWHDLEDGWRVCLVEDPADLPPAPLRTAPGLPTVTAHDGRGRSWLVPAVLDPQGKVALPMRLGITGYDQVDGQSVARWEHVPTPAQRRLIAIAQTVTTELTAGRFAQLPAHAAADMVAQLLSATYHLTPSVVGALGLIDDRLLVSALLVSAGHAG